MSQVNENTTVFSRPVPTSTTTLSLSSSTNTPSPQVSRTPLGRLSSSRSNTMDAKRITHKTELVPTTIKSKSGTPLLLKQSSSSCSIGSIRSTDATVGGSSLQSGSSLALSFKPSAAMQSSSSQLTPFRSFLSEPLIETPPLPALRLSLNPAYSTTSLFSTTKPKSSFFMPTQKAPWHATTTTSVSKLLQLDVIDTPAIHDPMAFNGPVPEFTPRTMRSIFSPTPYLSPHQTLMGPLEQYNEPQFELESLLAHQDFPHLVDGFHQVRNAKLVIQTPSSLRFSISDAGSEDTLKTVQDIKERFGVDPKRVVRPGQHPLTDRILRHAFTSVMQDLGTVTVALENPGLRASTSRSTNQAYRTPFSTTTHSNDSRPVSSTDLHDLQPTSTVNGGPIVDEWQSDILVSWIIENAANPFPDETTVWDLTDSSLLDKAQVIQWIHDVNQRIQVKKPATVLEYVLLARTHQAFLATGVGWDVTSKKTVAGGKKRFAQGMQSPANRKTSRLAAGYPGVASSNMHDRPPLSPTRPKTPRTAHKLHLDRRLTGSGPLKKPSLLLDTSLLDSSIEHSFDLSTAPTPRRLSKHLSWHSVDAVGGFTPPPSYNSNGHASVIPTEILLDGKSGGAKSPFTEKETPMSELSCRSRGHRRSSVSFCPNLAVVGEYLLDDMDANDDDMKVPTLDVVHNSQSISSPFAGLTMGRSSVGSSNINIDMNILGSDLAASSNNKTTYLGAMMPNDTATPKTTPKKNKKKSVSFSPKPDEVIGTSEGNQSAFNTFGSIDKV